MRLWFIFNHLINEGQNVVTLNTKKDEWGSWAAVCRGIWTSHAARVDEVLAIVLGNAVSMRVPTHQNVAIELSLNCGESFHVTPGDHLVPMDDSNLKIMDLHDFCLGQAGDFITVTLYNVSLAFCGSQVFQPLDSLNRNDTIICFVFHAMTNKSDYLPLWNRRCLGRSHVAFYQASTVL